MSEIDGIKCEYYNDYYKTCGNFSRLGDDETYCDSKEFKCSYYINNIEKQLQQLKAENELLKNERTIDLRNQLEKLKAENEELKEDNSTLKDILSYPKYTNEDAYNELLKLSKAELIKDLIESHQHGESTSRIVYRKLKEENKKYKQCLNEIEERIKDNIHCNCRKGGCEVCSVRPLCDKYYILQLIKQAKEGE